jgi:hypothetical protein
MLPLVSIFRIQNYLLFMDSVPIALGRALYFPYINIKDLGWLKTAALYCAGIDRIVPPSVHPGDLDEEHRGVIDQFNERESFISNISPLESAELASDVFARHILPKLVKEKKRNKYLHELGLKIPEKEGRRIHFDKVNYDLRRRLERENLAMQDIRPNHKDWLHFEPATFALYMTTLANTIAGERQIPMVTDDPAFQPLIQGLQEKPIRVEDTGFQLASIVIKSVVPKDIDNIPVKKIIEFRERYSDERHLFYYEVNKLVKDAGGIQNQETLEYFLRERDKDIRIAVRNLERAMKGMKFGTFLGVLSIGAPKVLGPMVGTVVKGGIIAVGYGTVGKNVYEWQRTMGTSPYTYVLRLRERLGREAFLKQMTKVVF